MKSMLLSMFTALTLSNISANVIAENVHVPRLIKSKSRALLHSDSIETACPTINECQLSSDGITYEKHTCNGAFQLVRKEYSTTPCEKSSKISDSKTTGPFEDPCCVNYCSPEKKSLVGVCEPTGRDEPIDPWDPESEVAPTYMMRYCNEDGSGGVYVYPYSCSSEKLRSFIMLNDPCCPQPSSCDVELNKCVIEYGRSGRYYCKHGAGLMLDTWQKTTDCSGDLMTIVLESDDCCPQPSCDLNIELNTCINGVGTSDRYYCTSDGLTLDTWNGEDCSGQFKTFHMETYDCCSKPACHRNIELDTCINESGNSKRYYCVNEELLLDSWDGTDCSGQLTTIPQQTGDCCAFW